MARRHSFACAVALLAGSMSVAFAAPPSSPSPPERPPLTSNRPLPDASTIVHQRQWQLCSVSVQCWVVRETAPRLCPAGNALSCESKARLMQLNDALIR